MSDLERASKAQLNNVLMAPVASLQTSLSSEDSSRLLAEMDSLTRRYPSQDQEGSIAEYFQDFERLALKFSLPKVVAALEELRISPAQKFFPKPDEVAEMIEVKTEKEYHQRRMRAENERKQAELNHRWAIMRERLAECGEVLLNGVTYHSLDEINENDPYLRGTKPNEAV